MSQCKAFEVVGVGIWTFLSLADQSTSGQVRWQLYFDRPDMDANCTCLVSHQHIHTLIGPRCCTGCASAARLRDTDNVRLAFSGWDVPYWA